MRYCIRLSIVIRKVWNNCAKKCKIKLNREIIQALHRMGETYVIFIHWNRSVNRVID